MNPLVKKAKQLEIERDEARRHACRLMWERDEAHCRAHKLNAEKYEAMELTERFKSLSNRAIRLFAQIVEEADGD